MKPSESPNMATWVAELRTTDRRQGQGALARVPDAEDPSRDEFCCLGLGCEVALAEGLDLDVYVEERSSDAAAPDPLRVYGGQSDLAPDAFALWLGFSKDELGHRHSGDFTLDWPKEFYTTDRYLREQGPHGVGDFVGPSITAARLRLSNFNDQGFTFMQIADLIDYFGIVPW